MDRPVRGRGHVEQGADQVPAQPGVGGLAALTELGRDPVAGQGPDVHRRREDPPAFGVAEAAHLQAQGPGEVRIGLWVGHGSSVPKTGAGRPRPSTGRWGRMAAMDIQIAQEAHADQVLTESAFALLCGMLLDQQFPMERAFAGPAKILDRFGSLEPAAVAGADPEEFASLCSTTPAIHRFPGSMAARIQAVAAEIVERYDGDTARLWTEASSGADLRSRLTALPGFGAQKAQIFIALLAKQLGVRPDGWEEAAGDYSETGAYRSVADVVDPASLEKVREFKQQKKRAANPG